MTCGLLGFSRQALNSWKADPVTGRDLIDACATIAALEVHREIRGSHRFIADELVDAGHELSLSGTPLVAAISATWRRDDESCPPWPPPSGWSATRAAV